MTLHLPGLLQIALLHRRQGVVDDDDVGLGGLDQMRPISSTLPLPNRVAGVSCAQRHDHASRGPRGRAPGPGRRPLPGAPRRRAERAARVPVGMDDDGALDGRLTVYGFGGAQSVSSSRRLVQLHGLGRHDGGDGVLVDQLRLAIAAQQHAEVVEPADHALQLDAVDQEDGQRRLGLADAVEEGVLQVLFLVCVMAVRPVLC